MALERTVVSTAIGGPPEFVTPAAGILVDPHNPRALAAALDDATTYPFPNAAAREAASLHDATTQASRMAQVLQQAIAGR
jgi:glycosyltransferase involved in cell wall biosynthesis